MQKGPTMFWKKIGSDTWHIPGCADGPDNPLMTIAIWGDNIEGHLCPSCRRNSSLHR